MIFKLIICALAAIVGGALGAVFIFVFLDEGDD